METTIEEFRRWVSHAKEDAHLEFKEAKLQYDFNKLLRYCVALANEGGGKFVLGVTDKHPRAIVGTQAFNDLDKIQNKIFDKLRFRVDLEELSHPDGRVVIFHIPSRPKGTAYNLEGAYLMRSSGALVPMSEDQLRKIFSEGLGEWLSYDAKNCCSDADVIRLLDVQSYFDMLKLPYPTNRNEVLDRLVEENLIYKKDIFWTITNLGAILFAKKLHDFDQLARKGVRLIVYDGVNKLKTKLDIPGVKGYAVGFDSLIEFIQSQTAQNEVIEQAIREDIKMYPTIAIRELVANALVHQDFFEDGSSIMIEIYSDRIEISNPGLPLIATNRFIDAYKSRNEKLADLMRRLGMCERKGSGVDKVVDAAEVFQLPAPDFRTAPHRSIAILFAHQEIKDMSRKDRIRACYQHCCLRYVMNQKMSNQSLRERFQLTDSKAEVVSRIIQDAIKDGQIKADDPESTSKRYAKYVPFWA